MRYGHKSTLPGAFQAKHDGLIPSPAPGCVCLRCERARDSKGLGDTLGDYRERCPGCWCRQDTREICLECRLNPMPGWWRLRYSRRKMRMLAAKRGLFVKELRAKVAEGEWGPVGGWTGSLKVSEARGLAEVLGASLLGLRLQLNGEFVCVVAGRGPIVLDPSILDYLVTPRNDGNGSRLAAQKAARS